MNLLTVFTKQQNYFKTGYTKSVTFRELQLNLLKKALKQSESKLLNALNLDLGNSHLEAYTTELGMIYKSINKTLKNLHKWTKPNKKKSAFYLPFSKAYVNSVGYGNVLVMSAFNYPLLLSIDPLIGAIAGGNTVMLALPKSSANVNKVIIEMLSTIFEEKFIYAFESDRNLNSEILTFKFNKIFYTGNSEVAKVVLKAASENLIPTTLELGGKSPVIVTKDANLNKAADSILWGKMLNAGQTCVAPDYILVDKLVSKPLIENILNSLEKMYGNNLSENKDYSRLINEKAIKRLVDVIKKDQQYVINQPEYDIETRFMSLVLILSDLNNVDNLESMKNELFGPVLPIIVYQNLNEAIDYINSHPTPLAFYPFSESKAKINYLLESVTFGGATTNDVILHLSNLNLPFGGLNNSGMGNYHGKYSFDTFTHKQAVLKTSNLFKLKLMHPPYSKLKYKLVKLFLK